MHREDVTEFAEMQDSLILLESMMAADNARLLAATDRLGVPPMGCDTAEWLADEIIYLRRQVAHMQPIVDAARLLHWTLDECGIVEFVGDMPAVQRLLVETMAYEQEYAAFQQEVSHERTA